MNRRTRALVVCDEPPKPVNSGGRMVLQADINALAEVLDHVTVVAFKHSDEDSPLQLGPANVRLISADRPSFKAATTASPLNPYQLSSRNVNQIRRADLSSIVANTYDLVVAEREWSIPAAAALRRWSESSDSALVLRSHNDEHEYLRSLSIDAAGPKKAYLYLERLRMPKRKFLRLSSQADAVWAISENDAMLYRSAGLNSRVLHPGLLDATAVSLGAARDTGKDLGFFGALDIPHSLSGLRWFIENVLPSIHETEPDARLFVAGRRAQKDTVAYLEAASGVTYLGELASPSDFYNTVAICINPVFAGSGVNIKVLDYIRHGLPVVSTTFGARGFEKSLPPASDSAASQAQIIVGLMKSVEARRETWRQQEALIRSYTRAASESQLVKLIADLDRQVT